MVGVRFSRGMGGDFDGEIARDWGRGWFANPALFFIHATFFSAHVSSPHSSLYRPVDLLYIHSESLILFFHVVGSQNKILNSHPQSCTR